MKQAEAIPVLIGTSGPQLKRLVHIPYLNYETRINSLSATRPGAVRKYAAASSSSSSSSSSALILKTLMNTAIRKRQFYPLRILMACEVSPDGSKFYILQGNPRRIRQYSLSTNFDISTAGSETSHLYLCNSSGVTCFRFIRWYKAFYC